jgi:hypothetical protein
MVEKVKYQCVYTGKLYDSEEEALEKCFGPIQTIIMGVDRFPPRGFFGTKVWR